MLTNKDIVFPYYSGNIRFTKCLGFLTLESYINSIQNPNSRTKVLLHNIAEATKDGDMKKKRKLKHQLFSFTPTVIIPKGIKRKYSNIYRWNPLMQIDMDGIESEGEAIQLKEHVFNNHKQIICAMVSPSKKGVKCLMKIKTPKSQDHYKALHKAMVDEFESYSYLDSATKNAVLPLFLGADKDILFRDFSEATEWDKENWETIEYVKLNDIPTHQLQKISEFTLLVENVVKKRINDIIDNGHTQVRSASLILGSRIAAGYIDEQDARILITNLIRSNRYLAKGTDGYLSTAMWGINQGMKKPKYF